MYIPIGGWVQPPTGSYGADTPDSERRIVNLATASGLIDKLVLPKSEPVTREDLLRVHPARYIDKFKEVSDPGGGDFGELAPFSKGGYEIALISAGLAKPAVDDAVTGVAKKTPMPFRGPQGITVCRTRHGILFVGEYSYRD